MGGLFDMIGAGVQRASEVVQETLGLQPAAPAQQPTAPGQGASGPTDLLGGMVQTVGDLGRGLQQEGLLGLLDPAGMADRQAAQRELAANFQIIDENEFGPHAGNQVTQEQFEQIARQYSDIRLGRTNFQFDTGEMDDEEAAQYRRDMMAQMGRVMQTGTGRELIDALAHNPEGHAVQLGAFRDDTGALDMTNAEAQPTDEAGAGTAGTGSATRVGINPGQDVYNVGRGTDAWDRTRGDVVLFHELSHAYHQVHGTEDQSGVVQPGEQGLNGSTRDADRGDIQRWEHQAVGLGLHAGDTTPNENRYRSERNLIGLIGAQGALADDRDMAQRGAYGD
jgi:hypothetical protein